MQSLGWYVNRLRTMSPAEVRWRVRSSIRDGVDRIRVASGRYPTLRNAMPPAGTQGAPAFRLTDVPVGLTRDAVSREAVEKLTARANDLAAHRLSFFGLDRKHLGDPIHWNREHESDRPTPTRFAATIDYRDYRVTGDAKVAWEPNRHQHFVVLGRAYRATGDPRYATAIIEQLTSWLDQCPYGTGMHWRSPLELGIRVINWMWAFDFIHESGLLTGAIRERALHATFLHLWDITRKYSRGSSANNHLVGEAAGVFIATSYFPDFVGAREWREESRRILLEEIQGQTFDDGCNREHAFGYHLFVLQFFLYAGLVARRSGADFPRSYWDTLERMMDFAARVAEAGPVTYGDADDGYVLDLGAPADDVNALLTTGAILFDNGEWKRRAGGFHEPAWWLFGRDGRDRFGALAEAGPARLSSHAFPESGYYLLQSGGPDPSTMISAFFDCAELGFGTIAAHGHADALSFTLRAFGTDVFVDPGTYDYFTYPEWRAYFRSTRAHNTLTIDDEDQSEMRGAFMWGSRARARCVEWRPSATGGLVCGEHDGYSRLRDPVRHRRTISLDGDSGTITIQDDVEMRNDHHVRLHFHLAEQCRVIGRFADGMEIAIGNDRITLHVDARFSLRTVEGCDAPGGGWVSRGYHRKASATTIVAEAVASGHSTFQTRVVFGAVSNSTNG
jgi:hypothetical protein